MSLVNSVDLVDLLFKVTILNIHKLIDSLVSTRFIVLIPPPEKASYKSWPASLEIAYKYYLERSRNQSVLTGQKREDYRH